MKFRLIGLSLILTSIATAKDLVVIDKFENIQSKYNMQGLPRYGKMYTMMDDSVQITDASGSWTEEIGTSKFSLTPNSVICIKLVSERATTKQQLSSKLVPKLVYHQRIGDAKSQVAIDMDLVLGEQVVEIALRDITGADWESGYAISIHGLVRIFEIEIILDRPMASWDFSPSLFDAEYQQVSESREIVLRKDTWFDDAYDQIMEIPTFELRQKLHFVFDNEPNKSLELTRRLFFTRFSHALTQTEWALFQKTLDGLICIDLDSIHDNKAGLANRFRFVGIVIGMAIHHGYPLNVQFAPSFYKLLLAHQIHLDDMATIDAPFHAILNAITHTDMSRLGVSILNTLNSQPSSFEVTNRNKFTYAQQMIKQKIKLQFGPQIDSLRLGLLELIPVKQFTTISVNEMDVLVSGQTVVDVNDWKSCTQLDGFLPGDPFINWFWNLVKAWDHPMRLKLLLATTGCACVPSTGLQGLFKETPFILKRSSLQQIELLPKRSTLGLPEFASFKAFQKMLADIVGRD